MENHWYYVENKNRVGPVAKDKIEDLFNKDVINGDTFIWRKGFKSWQKLNITEEFEHLFSQKNSDDDFPPILSSDTSFSWYDVDYDKKIFFIKIGLDRGKKETEYGPYSLNTIVKLFNDNRINGKTMIVTSELEDWIFLADIPIYEELFSKNPPPLTEVDRRNATRKPFKASLLFHDNSEVYDGVCRDVSIGGLQVLVSNPPVEIGDYISMNVHPGNEEFSFVARGEVVRLLDGKSGFSLRFLDLSKDAIDAINSYIRNV